MLAPEVVESTRRGGADFLPSNLWERRRLAGVSPFIPATAGKMPALPGSARTRRVICIMTTARFAHPLLGGEGRGEGGPFHPTTMKRCAGRIRQFVPLARQFMPEWASVAVRCGWLPEMKFFRCQGGSSVSGTVVFLSRRRFGVFRSFVQVFRRGVKRCPRSLNSIR